MSDCESDSTISARDCICNEYNIRVNHIDEHTLELYALKADEIAGRVDEIEEHLRECHGCRALVEEIVQYYDELKLEMQKLPKTELSTEQAIVRRQIHLKPYYEQFAPPVHYRPNTPLAKMFYFVRRHPVAVSISSFAIVGLLGWFLNDAIRLFLSDKVIKDTNPTYTYLNSATEKLEVYNKNHDLLWSIPTPEATGPSTDEKNKKTTVVTDLDGDGKNEVVTVLNSLAGNIEKRSVLRIFSSDKQQVREISFGRAIKFRDRQYQSEFMSGYLVVEDFQQNGSKEIIVSVTNLRSPSFISRLDKNGNVIGEYWHFGHIDVLYTVDLNGDGKKEVVLGPVNDLNDTTHKEFPVVIVLDPEKIVGQTESSCTSGFGLPKSEAEIFYIGMPRTNMDDVLPGSGSNIFTLYYTNDQILTVQTVNGCYKEFPPFAFDFIFSRDMKIARVKSMNNTDAVYTSLVQKGKLTGKIDQAYLNNIKNGVCYWDGKEWRKEWAMVKHSVVDGHQTVVHR